MTAGWPLIGFYMDNAAVRARREQARWRMHCGLELESVRSTVDVALVDVHGSMMRGRHLAAVSQRLREIADDIDGDLAALADGSEGILSLAEVA